VSQFKFLKSRDDYYRHFTALDIGTELIKVLVVRRDGPVLEFNAVAETLRRTTLGALSPGDRVNLEPALRAPLAVAIETYARCFLEQLASVIGPIAQKRVYHPRFDYHARIRAESGAAHHVVDVAQAAGGVVEEVIALARATQSPRYDHFAERDGERSIVVLEMQ